LAVERAIAENRNAVADAVEMAYRLHDLGQTVNPDSYFLRFPDRPNARIIALPAHLAGAEAVSGIKWISSFPENRTHNLARASAVLILNDAATGYPLACLEASAISAARTAASAALAAERLSPNPLSGAIGIVGTGVIARSTIDWLAHRGWDLDNVRLYDLDRAEAERFGDWLRDRHQVRACIEDRVESVVAGSSLVVFTTTAGTPYLADPSLFGHAPTVLHLSLRDIAVEVILASQNIVDDVEHCLKAATSLHLAEIATGDRDFVAGTLVDVLENRIEPDFTRPRIFSPFGLGVLDLAVGRFVFEDAKSSGSAIEVPEFFGKAAERWAVAPR
jgi:ornithine cyclodeaminase